MKTTIRVLLALAICFLAYICVMSVVTPINFENKRAEREVAVVEKLTDIRIAENEYRLQHGGAVPDRTPGKVRQHDQNVDQRKYCRHVRGQMDPRQSGQLVGHGAQLAEEP